jgi:soluble lytic murein transglycosylase-like protein
VLYAKILRKESGFRFTAINNVTQDYGIAQININTARAYNLSIHKLTRDAEYSIKSGAMVLAWFNTTYSHKESTWACRYNVGTGKKKGKLLKNCLAYLAKL